MGLLAVTLAAYWPVRLNGFINYDDQEYVTQNPHVSRGLSWQGVVWAFTSVHSANWHPLTWLSHMLDCTLFGLNPAGHHLTNLLFHAVNSVLLLLMLKQATGALWPSALVAALFALHPLHVESVAWVAERKDLLSAFFGLLCLWAYVCHAQSSSPGAMKPSSRFFYVLAIVFFLLGLLCKPMLVSLPFLMLLLDFWPLRRFEQARVPSGPTVRRLVVEKLPFLILACISSVVTWQAQQAAMNYYRTLPLELRLSNAIISYARYLGKMVWPRDLAILYPYPAHWAAACVFGAAALLALLTLVAWISRKRHPYFAVGWLWFLVMLVPVLGIVQVGVQAMADRYTYLPLVGIFVGLVWALSDVATRFRAASNWAGAICALLLLSCAIATRAQLRFWAGTEAVFTHAIAVTRDNWVAHYNLALLAMSNYEQARRGALAKPVAQSQDGGQAAKPHDYLRAVVAHCQAAVKANPGFPDPYVTLGKALTEQGELEAARFQLATAIRLDAKNADAHENLAEIAYRQGRIQDAVAEYRTAVGLRPYWETVLNNFAWVLATYPGEGVRNGTQAVAFAREACRLTGYTNLSFLHTLAAAYAEVRDFTNAVVSAQAACVLARGSGDKNIEQAAVTRLGLYQNNQPLRTGP